MADNSKKSSDPELKPEMEESSAAEAENPSAVKETGGGGWGGWGFSPLSYLSDLQKAATVAAEEISRNVCVFHPWKHIFFEMLLALQRVLLAFSFGVVRLRLLLLVYEIWTMVLT